MLDVKTIVTNLALEMGFDLVRVTSAQEFAEDRAVALDRLGAGLMDGLPWYTESRVLRGTDPQALLPGARSIICLGLSYYFPDDTANTTHEGSMFAGKVARYARVRDYHKVMKKRMRAYVECLSTALEIPVAARWYVDDGPMLDRAAASRSGLGWFGKNTNILTPSHGSWVFLGQVITNLELEPDPALSKTCGACVRCIDACPTGAIIAPYVIDNTRCISYLTIENRGPIPRELRPQMLDWVFGCDICQDVCPVNRKALTAKPTVWEKDELRDGLPSERPKGRDTGLTMADHPPRSEKPGTKSPQLPFVKGRDFHSSLLTQRSKETRSGGLGTLDLVELLQMTEDEFRGRFRGTPILRAKRLGLQRNACVALGNLADPAAVPALCRALAEGDPLVRGHAAWALGRIGTREASSALQRAALEECDPSVLEEINAAVEAMSEAGPVAPV